MKNRCLFVLLCIAALATTGSAQTAYITNAAAGNVAVLDIATGMITTTIPTGGFPTGVAIDKGTERAYITNATSANVTVINTSDNTVTDTIAVGNQPSGIVLSADGLKAYVANLQSNSVSVINTITETVEATIAVGAAPYGAKISPDGTKVYVANSTSGTVSVIDVATDMVTATITVGTTPRELMVSPDNSTVYVANFGSDDVSVVDANTNMVTAIIPTGGGPFAIDITTDGSTMYVTLASLNEVSVVNTANNTIITTIPVGDAPVGINITPDNSKAIVCNQFSDNVSIIDIATNTVETTVAGFSDPISLGDFIVVAAPGAALDFDGVDDRIVLPAANLLDNITGDYTISAWVNIDDNTVNQPIFSTIQNAPLNAISFSASSPLVGNRPLIIVNADGASSFFGGDNVLSANEWHHLLISYDAASGMGTMYVDGEVAGTGALPDMISDVMIEEAYLGYYDPGAAIGGHFSGQMDEVRIFNTASSCFDVAQLSNCELAVDTPGLELYYQFNQGIGGGNNTVITELTATAGPNGVLENFALTGETSNFVTEGGVTTGMSCEPVITSMLIVINTGTGMAVGNGEDMPSTGNGTDLGDVPVGGMVSTAFQLSGDDIDLANIASSNSLFSFMLSAEDLLVVSFNPAAVGTQLAIIAIATNDCSTNNLFTFTVQGSGILLSGDDCNDAFDINDLFGFPFNEPQVSGIYDNTEYTTNDSDPDFGYECFGEPGDGTGGPSLERTIWYAFTGDGNLYNITTIECNATDYIDNGDTQIAIYSGDCMTPIAAICGEDTDVNNFAATVDLVTEVGVTYLMMIDGFGPDFPADGEYCIQVTNLTDVGVTNLEATAFRIFPNPTTGNVQLPQIDLERVEAYDATGRLILTQQQPGTSIDLNAQPAGLYLLKLYNGEEVYSAKVVKE